MHQCLQWAACALVVGMGQASATTIVFKGLPGDRATFLAQVGATVTYTETFESPLLTHDAPLPSFSQAGITYTGLSNPSNTPNVFVSSAGYNNFGAGVGVTTSSVLTGNGDEHFLITFATPTPVVALDVYNNGLGPLNLVFYSGNSMLAGSGWTNGINNIRFVGVASVDQPITAIEFTSTGGGQVNTGVDNLAVASVPEPGQWALMLAGGALLASGLRRRR